MGVNLKNLLFFIFFQHITIFIFQVTLLSNYININYFIYSHFCQCFEVSSEITFG